MILTLIVLAVFIIACVLMYIAYRNDADVVGGICVVVAVISFILMAVFGCKIITAHINQDGQLQALNAKREAVVYELKNNIYLGDPVGDFNSKLIEAQTERQNPWLSWFHGSYIMDVKPIEIEG